MISIIQATTRDIPLIHDMASIVFPHTYRSLLSKEQLDFMMEWMYSYDNLKKQMLEENNTYYIAYVDGAAAGYVSIRPESDDIFHLEKIYVLPQFQKFKIGKKLFQQAIKAIKEMHPEKCEMHLNVNRDNVAVEFYEHMGMKKIAEGDFPIGNGFYKTDYIMGITI
jgi:diamine N-acetyltransferase